MMDCHSEATKTAVVVVATQRFCYTSSTQHSIDRNHFGSRLCLAIKQPTVHPQAPPWPGPMQCYRKCCCKQGDTPFKSLMGLTQVKLSNYNHAFYTRKVSQGAHQNPVSIPGKKIEPGLKRKYFEMENQTHPFTDI